jgi:hypothetical protein
MKLRELIVELQEIAESRSEAEVTFEYARGDGVGFTTRTIHLLAIDGCSARITLGDYESDVARYEEHVETMKRQER